MVGLPVLWLSTGRWQHVPMAPVSLAVRFCFF